jgi:ubiquitin carboxyl-terminal hydrolase 22/27/51
MRPYLSSSVLARRCGLRLHGSEGKQDAAAVGLPEVDTAAAAQYRAYAVVCHHGNMQGGHYTAYIR